MCIRDRFGSAAPEAARARIEGRAGAIVRLALPSGRHAIVPRLDGLTVERLGTEALISASPLPACARSPRGRRAAAPFGAWPVSYTHLRAHETPEHLVCRL